MSIAQFIIDHYDVFTPIHHIWADGEKGEATISFENGNRFSFKLEPTDDIPALNAVHQTQKEMFMKEKANRIHRWGWKRDWEPDDDEAEAMAAHAVENLIGRIPPIEDVYSQRIAQITKE